VLSLGSTQVNIDYNAYDSSNVNKKTVITGSGFPATQPRPLPASPVYSPRVTIASGLVDYSLFVNEAFFAHEGALDGSGSFLGSRSVHDFRLAPVSRMDHQPVLNPMVNKGVDTSLGTIRFQNYKVGISPDILAAPGLSGPGSEPLDTQYATINSWDLDCEGFGNRRIVARSVFPAPPQYSTYIDLGADEMGELVMAGFINGTRIFSRMIPNGNPAQPIPDHTQVFFFNVPTSLGGSASYPRPYYSGTTGGRVQTGYDYRWWQWVQETSSNWFPFIYTYRDSQTNQLKTRTSHYTRGETGSFRWLSKTFLYPLPDSTGIHWEPFMRNLECDFSPHLISDWHAIWAGYFSSMSGGLDEFAVNPWHHHNHVVAVTFPIVIDNHFLYYKPSHANYPSAVIEGTLNPPATWTWGGQGATGGYIGVFSTAQFGPYGYTGSSSYSVDGWGIGDVIPGPDTVPDSFWLGDRYNCEIKSGAGFGVGNLQSFLAVNGLGEDPLKKTSAPPAARAALTGPTQKQYEAAMKRFDFKAKRGK